MFLGCSTPLRRLDSAIEACLHHPSHLAHLMKVAVVGFAFAAASVLMGGSGLPTKATFNSGNQAMRDLSLI